MESDSLIVVSLLVFVGFCSKLNLNPASIKGGGVIPPSMCFVDCWELRLAEDMHFCDFLYILVYMIREVLVMFGVWIKIGRIFVRSPFLVQNTLRCIFSV